MANQTSIGQGQGKVFRMQEGIAHFRAFTLVELLVVIAIIGILLAMLLPALSRGKEAARSVSCGNNMHQLGLAAMTYSLDNRGQIPFFLDWLKTYPSPVYDVTTGKLYPYLRSRPVYICPTDQMTLVTRASQPHNRDYSYSINCVICHENNSAKFLAPSRTFLFMEANIATNDWSGMIGPVDWVGVGAKAISTRHNGRGYLIFCDFHLEKVNAKTAISLERSRRFWYPNTVDTLHQIGLTANLPDP
jgi:prepilin-type N-terminal cleavage/methylation domain-containing protein